MTVAYTTDNLLSSIKRRALVPSTQSLFNDADLLAMANEEMFSYLVPMMMSEREEFYVTEVGAVQNVVSGTAGYEIPYRAIGQALRDVWYYQSASVAPIKMRWLDYDRLPELYIVTNGTPVYFYLQNNTVNLVPTPGSTSGTIKTPYFIRPNSMVTTASSAQVASINIGANSVTVANLPTSITASSTVDIVRASGGFECLAIDQTFSGVSGTTLTFTSTLPALLAVGDWISIKQESPIPQLPAELHPLLAQRVAMRVLYAIGDLNSARVAENVVKEMTENAMKITQPRVQGEAKKIVAKNWWR